MSALERHLPGNDNIRRFPAAASPASLRETGLEAGFLLDLLLKAVFSDVHADPQAMGEALKLPTRTIGQILAIGLDEGLVDQIDPVDADVQSGKRYTLTEKGRERAQAALDTCGWTGAAPVPIESYIRVVGMQSLRHEALTGERLQEVFGGLIIPDALMRKLGPAADSASSIVICGPQGSGKSSIAAAMCEAYQDLILVPHAVLFDGRIIRVFDPDLHEPVADGNDAVMGLRNTLSFDQRYVLCKRPGLVIGSALTPDMLELHHDTENRTYRAPLQMKANGGVLVLDDLGHGPRASQEIINRLLGPLETRTDRLTLGPGHHVEVPFEVLVVFASEKTPSDLADTAALQRLRHRISLERPDPETFLRIFRSTAKSFKVTVDDDLLDFVMGDLYEATGRSYCAADPKRLIEQALSICAKEQSDPVLTSDLLARAWRHLPNNTYPLAGR
ncbi:MAG: hypothetical protein AAGD47_05635 [Pseudomonadota bacterium]